MVIGSAFVLRIDDWEQSKQKSGPKVQQIIDKFTKFSADKFNLLCFIFYTVFTIVSCWVFTSVLAVLHRGETSTMAFTPLQTFH